MESPAVPPMTDRFLSRFDIILLAETELTSARAGYLSRYVKNGGSLVAMRPAMQLAEVFGIVGTGEVLKEGCIRIDGAKRDGARISFRLEVPRSAPGVTLMLPVVHAGQKLRRISVDGHEESPASRHLKGRDYAFLIASPGTHEIVAVYEPLP